jgi:hypothetical protein
LDGVVWQASKRILPPVFEDEHDRFGAAPTLACFIAGATHGRAPSPPKGLARVGGG